MEKYAGNEQPYVQKEMTQMAVTELDKKAFLGAYKEYQKSCDQVVEARRDFLRTTIEVKARLAKIPIAPQGKGVESWDPAEAYNAAAAMDDWAESHYTMGRALTDQAAALRATADIATGIIEEARATETV